MASVARNTCPHPCREPILTMHFWVVESRPAFAMSPCRAYTAAQIRLYRVRWFFEHLEYNLTLSLLWVTLVRNLVVRP